jgi:hypothetical protein
MKITKTSLTAIAFLCLALSAHAQLRVPFTNNDLRNNLQKVITSFFDDLNSIKAAVITSNPQTIEYATSLHFEGAEQNTITQYNASRPIYSWQAVLLSTEDFDEASKKYKWLYNQLKTMTISASNGYTFSLDGDYDPPVESKKFSGSIFQLIPGATSLPKLKIEAGLQYYFPEWKITLTVYQKEREDTERGKRTEE